VDKINISIEYSELIARESGEYLFEEGRETRGRNNY
jgi:hypothetical protein